MIRRIRQTLASLTILALPLLASAQKVAVPENVPADVQAYLSIVEPAALYSSYAQTPLAPAAEAFTQLPAFKNEAQLQEFLLALDKASLDLGYSLKPADLLGQHLKGADLYFVQPAGTAEPQVLLVGRFTDAAKATALRDFLEAELKKQSDERQAAGQPPYEITHSEVAGVQITSNEAEHAHFGVKNDLFLLGTTTDAIKSSLESPGEERLKNDANMVAAFSALRANSAQVYYYASRDALQDIGTREGRPNMFGFPEESPLGIAGVVNVFPDRLETSAITYKPAAPGTEFKPSAGQRKISSFGSAKPLFALLHTKIDGAQILSNLEQAGTVDPQVGAQVGGALSSIEQALAQYNLSLRDDVIPAFGPEGGFFFNRMDMNNTIAPFDVLLVLKIRDAEKAKRVVSTFETSIIKRQTEQAQAMGMAVPPSQPATEQYGDVTIRSIPYQSPVMPLPMAISNATTPDGYVMFGVSTAGLKEAIDRSRAAGAADAQASQTAGTDALVLLDVRQSIGSLPIGMFMMGAPPEDRAQLQTTLAFLNALGTLMVTSTEVPEGTAWKAYALMK